MPAQNQPPTSWQQPVMASEIIFRCHKLKGCQFIIVPNNQKYAINCLPYLHQSPVISICDKLAFTVWNYFPVSVAITL